MPFSDTIHDLDARIRATVEKTVTDLRQELLERLQNQSQQLREQVEALAPALPDDFLPSEDIDAALAEAAADERERARGATIRELKAALGEFDGARTQADILGSLLTQAGLHASRTAIFLAEPERIRGWCGHGFDEAEERLRSFVLERADAPSVARVLEGRGVVRMSSADRIRLSSELEITVPGEALLIPLVLRDRVAGTLYADRVDIEGLTPEILQILTHVASLALETLPLRQRASTPTLLFEDEVAEAGGLPVWGAATVAAAGTAEPPAAEEEEVTSAAAGIEDAAELEIEPEPAADETRETEAPESVAAESFEVAEVEFEAIGEAEEGFVGAEAAEPESVGTEEFEPGAPAETFAEEGFPEAPPREPGGEAAFSATASFAEPEAELEEPPPGVQAGAVAEEDTGEIEVELEEEDVTAEPRPAMEATPPTQMPPRPVSEIRPPGVGSQVQPPSDVQGPGWAFSSESQRDSNDEARHQEAQRLARLLVSEIKLYNEEQVNEGRRNHDLFERLKEDIERSRQLYESRVDEQVRESTDYFYQEMVRVLGAGDPKTLGI